MCCRCDKAGVPTLRAENPQVGRDRTDKSYSFISAMAQAKKLGSHCGFISVPNDHRSELP